MSQYAQGSGSRYGGGRESYTTRDGQKVYLEEIKPRWGTDSRSSSSSNQRQPQYHGSQHRRDEIVRQPEHANPGAVTRRDEEERRAGQAGGQYARQSGHGGQYIEQRQPAHGGQYIERRPAQQSGGQYIERRQPAQYGGPYIERRQPAQQSGGQGLAYGVDPLYDQWRQRNQAMSYQQLAKQMECRGQAYR